MSDWRAMALRVLGEDAVASAVGLTLPGSCLPSTSADFADSARSEHLVLLRAPDKLPTVTRVPRRGQGRRGPRCHSTMAIADHFALLGGHSGVLDVYGDLELAHRLWDSHRLWMRDAGTPLADRWDLQYRATWHRFLTQQPNEER